MVFAQNRLMLLQLAFQLAEGYLATASGIFRGARGMQRAGGQRQIQRKGVLFFPGVLRERAMQLDQIRFIAFQKTVQFRDVMRDFGLDGLVRVDVPVADRHFHNHTCGGIYGRTRRREFSGTGHECSLAPRDVRGNGTDD